MPVVWVMLGEIHLSPAAARVRRWDLRDCKGEGREVKEADENIKGH